MWLKDKIVKGEHIAMGHMAYAPFSYFDYDPDKDVVFNNRYASSQQYEGRRLPTNCKNCGAPLHGNRCEYCDTEY